MTTTQYVEATRRLYDRKIKRELLTVIGGGFLIAAALIYLGASLVMWMVSKGWIN
jgi:uncharacterized membrane protein